VLPTVDTGKFEFAHNVKYFDWLLSRGFRRSLPLDLKRAAPKPLSPLTEEKPAKGYMGKRNDNG
jgi:hypothetical protein